MQAHDKQKWAAMWRRGQPWKESALVREARAWEYAAQAAGTKEQMAEWAEPPEQTVLRQPVFSLARVRLVSALQAWVAVAAFEPAYSQERLARVLAQGEQALAAFAASAAQASSQEWETTLVRAV